MTDTTASGLLYSGRWEEAASVVREPARRAWKRRSSGTMPRSCPQTRVQLGSARQAAVVQRSVNAVPLSRRWPAARTRVAVLGTSWAKTLAEPVGPDAQVDGRAVAEAGYRDRREGRFEL
ncbi:hypothetical protein [Streptomyces sp. Tu 3180]|uniref:hypothetical protein n=1 Tax=Streptomyces sp. Tu 3180 TaxID=2682611 RepID=UPI001FB7F328|nr:hypothetical protein [Streptomyces sp. Tu 3180]